MKLFSKSITALLIIAMLVGCFAACGLTNEQGGETTNKETESVTEDNTLAEFVDYAGTVKLDKASGRKWCEASVRLFVDGDTTHFNVPSSVSSNGVLKARYLAINTPESTGQIEPYGKKASNFTKEALSKATSIIIESDTASWNLDSTGDRFLVWVWYKTADSDEYRNLNLEILQNGLALASNSSDNSYGDTCVKILSQAIAHKLNVHSKEKDPDFYYGAAKPITLKELKTNIETYKDTSVSFEGVVVRNSGNTAYVEEYDEETGLYFGIQVYYGFNLDYNGSQILNVGNRVLIVGSVQYYEAGGTYQVSDIKYHSMRPDHEENIKLVSEGHTASYQVMDASELLNKKVEIDVITFDDDGNESVETRTYDQGFLTMHASASLENLTIQSIYTTDNDGSNDGALSITCTDANGTTVVIRTVVLKDANGETVTEDAFPIGSVINARGVVDVYNGVYQLKVFSVNDITFVGN